MEHFLSTLSSKGQLTLPKPLRDHLHLKEGTPILLEIIPGGVVLKKAEVRPSESEFSNEEWEELKRLAEPKGKTYKSGKNFLNSLK